MEKVKSKPSLNIIGQYGPFRTFCSWELRNYPLVQNVPDSDPFFFFQAGNDVIIKCDNMIS